MATKEEHLKQYEHNRKLINEEIFNLQKTEYLDWVVTICFYCAVHLVEMTLAAKSPSKHSSKHKERFPNINADSDLRKIRSKYQSLYNSSILSRYSCHSFNKLEVLKLMCMLDEICSAVNKIEECAS